MDFLKKVRAVLGKLTDLLLAGRARGWWEKGQGPDFGDDGIPREFRKPR